MNIITENFLYCKLEYGWHSKGLQARWLNIPSEGTHKKYTAFSIFPKREINLLVAHSQAQQNFRRGEGEPGNEANLFEGTLKVMI